MAEVNALERGSNVASNDEKARNRCKLVCLHDVRYFISGGNESGIVCVGTGWYVSRYLVPFRLIVYLPFNDFFLTRKDMKNKIQDHKKMT